VAGSGGVDTVYATISFDLGDGVHAKGNVENLTLLGTKARDAIGNKLANTLVGNASANLLDGKGGADIMRGLGGNDRYVVDHAGDVVDESAAGSGGVDTVRASVSFDLREGTQVRGAVENLKLTGKASLDGTGNALANRIIGNQRRQRPRRRPRPRRAERRVAARTRSCSTFPSLRRPRRACTRTGSSTSATRTTASSCRRRSSPISIRASLPGRTSSPA
jgi:hypothetical protein